MTSIYEVLQNLGISYTKVDHPAVFTVKEASEHPLPMGATECKNLFLRNRKGDTQYLYVVEARKTVDLKALARTLGEKSLGFASPERLLTALGVTPGSVSPFALINNDDHRVRVLVDKELFAYDYVGFHPNINIATLIITSQDFKKFLEWTGNSIQVI